MQGLCTGSKVDLEVQLQKCNTWKSASNEEVWFNKAGREFKKVRRILS